MAPVAGIYVHWPFCERKCPYCDFYTFGREHPAHARQARYLDALLDEIRSAPARLGWAVPPEADTLYFGGGTPSLMGPAALAQVLDALRAVARLHPAAEITLEVNPTTAEAADIPSMLALGVNRLSVGCQSFDDRLLAALGRVHDAATTRRAIERMRAAGARLLSLDLMFGVPGQTLADLDRDLDAALAFAPEHLSAYGLTLHEGTPYARWAREGRIRPADDDLQAAMFERLMDRLAEAGYEHYEISNWARPGFASRHNAKYWTRCDVWAFGVAAHGVAGGRRFANPPDLDAYLDPARRRLAMLLDPPADERARRGEIMMLALRRIAGATWAELDAWMGCSAREAYAGELAQLADGGLLDADALGVRLTRRGLLVADAVMARFF